ncbi:MAG TPA: ABC transporter ATP-binding protein [Candidatus Dormibacteraeota bacterium]|nr:ABC transporter ATP-binding protein [Candidatus Dormibacteraeota bacterium]
MTAAMSLRVEGVTKHYRAGGLTVKAVDGLDIEIEAGSSVAIVGPSGCGKSTLLGMLGGLERPSSGRIWLDRTEISSLPEAERARIRRESIGFVFQSYDLLPFLTARENIEFQQALNGANGSGTNGKSDHEADLIKRLGLSEHATKFPDQLSGGQRQRVGIARALAHGPRLILGDEPTGELDSETSASVLDLLLEAQETTGATLVVVTHDADVAERLGRVVTLRDGKVVSDGSAVRRA